MCVYKEKGEQSLFSIFIPSISNFHIDENYIFYLILFINVIKMYQSCVYRKMQLNL